MSWMRWPVYVWGSGSHVHLWARSGEEAEKDGVRGIEEWCLDEGWAGGLSMSMTTWDELVVLRMAQLARHPKRLRRTVKRLHTKGRGNAGAWEFFEMLGDDPAAEFAAMLNKQLASGNTP